MYIPRHLDAQILAASKDYPVVMLTGQRQVGKSTMLHHLMEEKRRYVSLNDSYARRLAEDDPALFFETFSGPLLLDEFQRVPALLLEIKKLVDLAQLKGQPEPGRFWLTGSQKFEMMQGVSESLAGRVAVFEMSSLSAAELDGRPAKRFSADLAELRQRRESAQPKSLDAIYEQIFLGGMPKLRATEIDRERFSVTM